jgi:cell division protein FtsW (lipid II flippase)
VIFSFLRPANSSERLQLRLFLTAVAFIFLVAIALTFAPAARVQSWSVDFHWGQWIGFLVWLIVFAVLIPVINHRLPDHDPYLLPIIALLSGWGLITIWRLNSGFGYRQTIWILICGAAVWALLRVKNLLGLLQKYKYIWLLSGLLLTALTFIFGVYPGGEGPRLWLRIAGIYFQPSEPLKLLLIIFLSAYLANRLPVTFNFARLIIPSFILFLSALGILIAQHDLGTASIFVILYIAIIFLASNRRRMLIVGGTFLATAGLLGYKLYHVIQIRVNAWLNPWLDPAGGSYQIIQSLLAFAAGGVFGRGPGLGNPGLVPIAHSDFITAAIGEEYGLIGTFALFVLLSLFAMRGVKIAISAKNQYQRYLAAGITTYLIAQSILIIGGNLRLLPLTGVTLPFISYGGSSLITSFIAGLLLLMISNDQDEEIAPLVKSSGFQMLQAIMLISFIGLSLSNGWWSLVRSDDLQTRADNPRLSIAEKYSHRGSILDHSNQVIVQTEGESGDYWRHFLYPPLSSTTGYNDPVYGQSGLEASLDGYLRGVDGNPSSVIWWHHFLYGEPPPGLDVRLSIDLTLQQKADELLAGHTGALVVMNAKTGEILVMASHPNIDPNQVSSQWANWMSDPSSPLLNRATQSEYTLGTSLGVFLMAGMDKNFLPQLPDATSVNVLSETFDCTGQIPVELSFTSELSEGCPAATLTLSQSLSKQQLINVIGQFGFLSAPNVPLEVAIPTTVIDTGNLSQFLFGSNQLRVTPLQITRAAAAITNGGSLVSPRLVSSIKNPLQGWIVLPVDASIQITLPDIKTLSDQLRQPGSYYWEVLASSQSQQGKLTWFIAGTTPDWQGTPLAVALVLEEDNPSFALSAGEAVLNFVANP